MRVHPGFGLVLAGLLACDRSPPVRTAQAEDDRQARAAATEAVNAARRTALRQGDVILQINRLAVATADDTRRAFRAAAGRTPVRVYFERGGQLGIADFYVQ